MKMNFIIGGVVLIIVIIIIIVIVTSTKKKDDWFFARHTMWHMSQGLHLQTVDIKTQFSKNGFIVHKARFRQLCPIVFDSVQLK